MFCCECGEATASTTTTVTSAAERIIFCVGCESAYHAHCINNFDDQTTSSSWFCKRCVTKRRGRAHTTTTTTTTSSSSSQFMENVLNIDVASASWLQDSKHARFVDAAPQLSKVETDSHCDYCYVCGLPGTLLCCDTCPAAVHLACTNLISTPKRAWVCTVCEGNEVSSMYRYTMELHRQAQHNAMLINSLHTSDHTERCFACRGGGRLICCDVCSLAFHISEQCAGLTEEPNGGFWECLVCRGEVTHEQYRQLRMNSTLGAQLHACHLQRIIDDDDDGDDADDEESNVDKTRQQSAEVEDVMQRLRRCAFCQQTEDTEAMCEYKWTVDPQRQLDMLMVGPWYDRTSGSFHWTHRVCAVWAPRVYVSGRGKFHRVAEEIARGQHLRCAECRRKGAVLGCADADCRRTYHVDCARSAFCYFDTTSFVIRCPLHALSQHFDALHAHGAIDTTPPPAYFANAAADRVSWHESQRRIQRLSSMANEVVDAADVDSRREWIQSINAEYLHAIRRPYISSAEIYSAMVSSHVIASSSSTKRKDEADADNNSDHDDDDDDDDNNKEENTVESGGKRSSKRTVKQLLQQQRKRLRRHTQDHSHHRPRPRVDDADNSSLYTLNVHDKSWDSVGGLRTHIHALKECVLMPLLYPHVFQHLHVTSPGGVLLYGPPGTGKTLLARALSTHITIVDAHTGHRRPVAFFARKATDLLSQYHGETEQNLRALFELAAHNAPAIVLFDEIDALTPVRSSRQNQVHSSVVTTLLSLLDGVEHRGGRVFVLATTNRLEDVDPALRRPGRFDRELYVPLPNHDDRVHILKIHTRAWHPQVADETLAVVASRTHFYSGADLRGLCTEALLHALRRCNINSTEGMHRFISGDDCDMCVGMEDLLAAVHLVKPRSSSCTAVGTLSVIDDDDDDGKGDHARAVASVCRRLLSSSQSPSSPPSLHDSIATESAVSRYSILMRPDLPQPLPPPSSSLSPSSSPISLARSLCRCVLVCGDANHDRQHAVIMEVLKSLPNLQSLPVVRIDMASLFVGGSGDGGGEKSCTQLFRQAHTATPSVVYMPRFNELWSTLTSSIRAVLQRCFDDCLVRGQCIIMMTFTHPLNATTVYKLQLPLSMVNVLRRGCVDL